MLFFTLLVLSNASAKTIYVDWTNSADPSQDGTAAHPFDTIQEAVYDANASDEIVIANGTYPESVSVNRSVSIAGNGSVSVEPGSSDHAFDVTYDNVTIQDILVEGARHGVHIQSQNNVDISRLEIGNCTVGVWALSSSYIDVFDTTSRYNDENGIYLELSDNCTVRGGVFSSNDQHGIHLEGSVDNTFRDLQANDNAHNGIHLYGNSESNSLRWSTLTGNSRNVNIRGSDDQLIRGCDLTNSVDASLFIYNSRQIDVWDSETFPGNVSVEILSELEVYNTSVWDPSVGSDSELTIWNWIRARVVTAPPTSFGISDADLRITDRWDTSNDTIYSTEYYGGTDDTTDTDGWTQQVLVLTREYDGTDLTVHNHTLDVHYYGWTNSTVDANVTMGGVPLGKGATQLLVNASTEIVFEYPLVVYYGDVTIDAVTDWTSLSVIVFGNLTIGPTGHLTLNNTQLWIASNGSTNHIEVQGGGTLEIVDGDGDSGTTNDASVVSPLGNGTFTGQPVDVDPELRFWARSNSDLVVRNSILAGLGTAGDKIGDRGLLVETNDVTFVDVNFSYCRVGLYLNIRSGVHIVGCSFYSCDIGIYSTWSNDIVLEDPTFENGGTGIEVVSNVNLTVIQPVFNGVDTGAIVSNSSVSMNASEFVDTGTGLNATGSLRSLDVSSATFTEGGVFAWIVGEHPAPFEANFENVTLVNASTGIHVDGSVLLHVHGTEIIDTDVGLELWNLIKRPELEDISIHGTLTEEGIVMVDVARANVTTLALNGLFEGVRLDNCSNIIITNVGSAGCYRTIQSVDGGSMSLTNATLDMGGVLGSKGIVSDGTSDLVITRIDIVDGESGIDISGGTDVLITMVNTSGTSNGLVADGTDGLVASACTFTGGDVGASVSGTGSVLNESHFSDTEEVAASIGGSGNSLLDCTMKSSGTAVHLSGSGHTVADNAISDGSVGIALDDLSEAEVYGNTIEDCGRGIQFTDCHDNSVFNNEIEKEDSDYGLYFGGDGLYNDVKRSNRVNGVRTYFYFEYRWTVPSSLVIDTPSISNMGQVIFVNCSTDLVFQNCNITVGDIGLYALNTQNLHVIDTEFSWNDVGIRMENCSDIEVNYTTIYRADKAISIEGSTRILIGANGTLRRCNRGIEAIDSMFVRASDSIRIEDCKVGIHAYNTTRLRLQGTSTQRVWISGTETGIRVLASVRASFEQGVVKASKTGVLLDQCEDTELGAFELRGCDVGMTVQGGTGLATAGSDTPTFDSCVIGMQLADPHDVVMVGATYIGCDYGLDLEGGTDVLIDGCTFDTNGMAVTATHADGLTVTNCKVQGEGDGFHITDSAGLSINGTTRAGGSNLLTFVGVTSSFVSDTSIEDTKVGVELDGSTDIVISDVTARFTETSPIGAPYRGDIAFHVQDSNDIDIIDVSIDRYDGGIHVSGGRNVTVSDSTISSAGYRGVSMDDTEVRLTTTEVISCYVGVHSYLSVLTIEDVSFSDVDTAISGNDSEVYGKGVEIMHGSSVGLWLEGSIAELSDIEIDGTFRGIVAMEDTWVSGENVTLSNNTVGVRMESSNLNLTLSTLDYNRVGVEADNSTVGILNVTFGGLEVDMELTNTTASLVHVALMSAGITGISADAGSITARALSASELEVCLDMEGGELGLRGSELEGDLTAIDASMTSMEIEECTLSGGVAALRSSGGDLKVSNSAFVGSGTGVDLSGVEVKRFRSNSLEDCSVALDVTSSIMPHIVGMWFLNNSLDLSMDDAGVVIVTDTSFGTWKLKDTSVEVRNYLTVRIVSQATGYGMRTGEVRVWDTSGGDIYATPYFNGTNATTGKDGYTDSILARSATYTSSGVTYFNTGVELKMPGWFMKDYGIDMNTSHVETYTYGMTTFQTIEYVGGRNQTGLIGTTLEDELEVVVKDDETGEMEGIAVVWTITYPNATDAMIWPEEAMSDHNGSVRCNVTLPSNATNLTVIAYLKLDPIKNVTFELLAEGIEFDLEITTTGQIYIGDEVVFEVESELVDAQYFLDFGDGSNTGWTNETMFTHSYRSGTFTPNLKVLTSTGLVSAPVFEEVRVQDTEIEVQKEEAEKTAPTQFIIPLFVLIIVIITLAVKVLVPELGRGMLKRRPRPKKDIEFMEGEEFELEPEEPAKKPAPPSPKKGGETLEDLIIGLEKHKKDRDEKEKKRSFLTKEPPTRKRPARRPPAGVPGKRKKGGKK